MAAARNRALLVAALFAGCSALGRQAHAQEDHRIVAIADVHGAYEPFVELLTLAGLVGSQLEWTGAAARLIIVGDVLDRGAGSRAVLELIMQLERTAPASGGRVELVLGNHEIMNLVGDLRYVSAEEYSAYAADESPSERTAAWNRFRAAAANAGADDELAAQFASRYPPGFFGHRTAFRSDAPLGRWLLERPVLLVLDDTAFVHGGLPVHATAQEINDEYRETLREYLRELEVLSAAGAVHPEDAFHDHGTIAARFVERAGAIRGPVPESIRRAARRIVELGESTVLGPRSLVWYRGTASCSAAIERDRVDRALRALGAARVVIGHTPTRSARIESRFDRTVLRADTGMLAPYYGGRAAAVVIDNDEVGALYVDRAGIAPLEPQRRRVGAHRLDDDALEALLQRAPIVERSARGDGSEAVRLELDGVTVAAVFTPIGRGRDAARFVPDVAAYRLDRLLDFELVAVTVLRDIDGRLGSIAMDIGEWPDERQRAATGQTEALCPLEDQMNLMRAFDLLVHHEDRRADEMRYGPGLQLTLTGNRRGFGRQSGERSAYARAVDVHLSQFGASRLRALTPESLAAQLGDVLDERRRAALLARRDQLLESAQIDRALEP